MSKHIQYEHPGDIDADPAEVGDLAIEQLHEIMGEVLALVAETQVQVRSSYQTRLLDAHPDLEASEVAIRWTESDLRNRIERVGSYLTTIRAAISACKLG